jgi:hypothetical protein
VIDLEFRQELLHRMMVDHGCILHNGPNPEHKACRACRRRVDQVILPLMLDHLEPIISELEMATEATGQKFVELTANRDRWVKIAERLDSDMEALAANAQRADDRAERLARQVKAVRALAADCWIRVQDWCDFDRSDNCVHCVHPRSFSSADLDVALASAEGPEQ